jgi:hypothetical protein
MREVLASFIIVARRGRSHFGAAPFYFFMLNILVIIPSSASGAGL